MTRVRVRSAPTRTLSDADLEEIWTFYARFVDRPKAPFLDAVRKTQHVFVGREADGAPLRAFAAARIFEVPWNGGRCGMLYAAYAAIDPAYRGGHVIQLAGAVTYLRYRRRHPFRPAYFLMMSSTYKSYLLLARNFASFWPRRDAPMPARERALLDLAMRDVGGDDWDAAAGVVRRYGVLRYLEGVVADDGDQADPDVAFYGAMNPGQPDGDSLACIAPMSLRNWSVIGRRAARRTWRAFGQSRPRR